MRTPSLARRGRSEVRGFFISGTLLVEKAGDVTLQFGGAHLTEKPDDESFAQAGP